jgi:hypothetical protein
MDFNSEDHAASRSMSTIYKTKTAIDLIKLQKWQHKLFLLWVPLCFAVLIMSCLWSDIQGRNTDYTNPGDDWQACLTQADYSYIPLNATIAPAFKQIANIRSGLTTCVIDEFLTGKCTYGCVANMSVDCFSKIAVTTPVVPNVALPTGHYLAGLSYLGVQTIIFSAIAHGSLHRALRHPSWLVSTIALLVWFFVAIFTYYTVNPIFAVPAQTNSTFLTYLFYNGSFEKYSNLNNGNNECHTAFRYVWVYLCFMLGIAATVLAGLFLAVYGEIIRYKSKNKKTYEPLEHTSIPCILGIFAVIFYLLILLSKILSSFNTLEGIAAFDLTIAEAGLQKLSIWYPPIWFPFVQPSLDIATILGIFCFMSILRGYTIQSVSAFRAAFGCSFVYALSMYPAVVGGFQFYRTNDFSDYSKCYNYFLEPSGESSIFIRCI